MVLSLYLQYFVSIENAPLENCYPKRSQAFDHVTIVGKARNFHERLSRGLIRGVIGNAGNEILTSQTFTNHWCNHAQRSFVMFFFSGKGRAKL